MPANCPAYLARFADLWATDPHAANLAWWRSEARSGLFLHYGLYSQLARGEWVMQKEGIPVTEYEQLFKTFDPSGFDPEAITDLALAAGMSYVNLTTCHHEGFCLWDSTVEPFNSVKACGRDLVRELAQACDRKGLGFFCYFTYPLNWRHPYAATKEMFFKARPEHPDGDPRYLLTEEQELVKYWKWSHGCIRELCQLDVPIAGIWLDIIRFYYDSPHLVPVEETYALIREHRPEALISFKQGATGTEDFAAPEFHFHSQGDMYRRNGNPEAAERADHGWAGNVDKRNEICMTIMNGAWGYCEGADWKDADELWRCLAYAEAHNCNLLANIGPKADGSLPADPVATLTELGQRIRTEGWPEPNPEFQPSPRKTGAGAS